MLKLFGGLMLGDGSDFTPRIDTTDPNNPQIVYQPFVQTDVYGQPLPPQPQVGDAILPAQSYDLRRDAAFVGMVNLSSTLDQTLDFAARTRITIAGSQSDPVHDSSVPQATFTDPSAGTVYHAYEVDGPDSSVGFKLLNDAQAAADDWQVKKAALNANPNDTTALTAFDAADAKLQDKIQLIDFLVYAGNILEYSGR
jgi:hypothetical protein